MLQNRIFHKIYNNLDIQVPVKCKVVGSRVPTSVTTLTGLHILGDTIMCIVNTGIVCMVQAS